MVLLTSSDNQEFRTEKDVIMRSVLVRNMLEDVGENENMPIPLPNVNAAVLQKVLEFCEHHRKDPIQEQSHLEKDIITRPRRSEIPEWDQQYFAVDKEMLFEVILAANYLDIKDLLDVGCMTVANLMIGKSTEEIRELFNVANDFTPEEEEQIRRENEWAEDR